MHVTGIIAEYNPLHLGHAHLLRTVRRAQGGGIVVALSGGVMQRGEFPLFGTALRTRAALMCGADLVLEIPAPYALQSAEGYAKAGVRVLSALGVVNTLAFGTESACTESELFAAAEILNQPENEILKDALHAGQPYHAARAAALSAAAPEFATLAQNGNNILALEYARAVLGENAGMALMPIPRLGPAHGAPEPGGGFASASFLRSEIAAGRFLDSTAYIPKEVLPLYSQALNSGEYFMPDERFSALVIGKLRTMDAHALSEIDGIGEGLEHALLAAANNASDLNEVLLAAKSKRYPYTRLARASLSALLGYGKDLSPVPYLHVLGANERGFEILREAKEKASLPISHSLAELAKFSPAAAICAGKSATAADVYALLQKAPAAGGSAFTQPMVTL